MKRNEGKSVFTIIAAAVFTLWVAGCTSVPSAEMLTGDFEAQTLADARP